MSPFCALEGSYRFRFLRTDLQPGARAPRTVVRIDHDDADGPVIQTSVSGHLQPLTASALRAAFFATPLMTLFVVARIHWQALRLFARRVPFFRKPQAPSAFVTR